jgi:DtxR family Mn-dependent transcriptional regulator
MGRIVRIRDVSPLLLAYLSERDVQPGSAFSIEEIAPFNGPQSVRVGENVHVLGREIADHIMVEVGS